MTDTSWVAELSNLNLLAVLDVALDLTDATRLSERATIKAVPDLVRFPLLMPHDGPNWRDRYLDLRANALQFLRGKAVIKAMVPVTDPYTHRWESRAQIDVDLDALGHAHAALQAEYHKRHEAEADASSLSAASCPVDRLKDLVFRFHGAVLAIRDRYGERPTLDVTDEYDVQDLMSVLLTTEFDDIRPEEHAPSYGGGASRTDFLLKAEQIVLEVKKTRSGLADRQIGEQLIVDSARYAKHPDCKTLVCMVYDPENRISNPSGLEADLSGEKNGITVEVLIVPRW